MSPRHRPLRVLFDVTRLLARSHFATPTGIDRVDQAYLGALNTTPGIELHLVKVDAWGPHLVSARETEASVRTLLQPARVESVSTAPLVTWLRSPAGTPRPPSPLTRGTSTPPPSVHRLLDRPLANLRLSRLMRDRARGPSVYLNTSHGQSYRQGLARWLRATRLPAVFFLHDLLPIQFPQFNRAQEPARHASRLRTISLNARRLIVNSAVTRDAMHDYLEPLGMRVPPTTVLPLGVGERFVRGPDERTSSTGGAIGAAPYFVVLGTVEPRKNHALLLRAWRAMAAGGDTHPIPRLVVLGRRGWHNEAVFALLDRDSTLQPAVIEWPGLDDGTIIDLLRGARALLAPSFAEGYHLPVAEALTLGTPVIASDIAAHREIGAGFCDLIDPSDDASWLEAVRDYARPGSTRRAQRVAHLEAYRPPRWSDHLDRAMALLNEAAHQH